MKTLIIVIMDESGSMGSKKSDVIGGYNSFIEDQKQIKNDSARLFMVKFNTTVSVVHTGVQLSDVPPLNSNTYLPGGGTALYDAISESVRIAKKDKTSDERVICVIMTDGEENSSRETSKSQVREIISAHEAVGDWTFLYIGENPEKWTQDTGMSSGHGIDYNHSNPRSNYLSANLAVSKFRNEPKKKGFNLFSLK